jgi:hypothetical protein
VTAVTFLSVKVNPHATHALLKSRAQEFADLLAALGPDRDLVDEEHPLDAQWAGWRLQTALRTLYRTGPTTASKLLARKRPRLRPIWDSVVSVVTATQHDQWEPVRVALREDDKALHRRLQRLREKANLPVEVSALRVLDVIAWLEGKQNSS